MDPETVQRVEQELDQFVERHAREAKDATAVEQLWAEQERAHRERRREAHRQQWCDFHRHMQALHADLAAEHRAKAAELIGGGEAMA